MDDGELQDRLQLLGKFGKLSELYHVETYRAYRENKDGGMTAVTIELWDAGPERRDMRWTVAVKDDEGREATGNPDGSLEVALAGVHWQDLDK